MPIYTRTWASTVSCSSSLFFTFFSLPSELCLLFFFFFLFWFIGQASSSVRCSYIYIYIFFFPFCFLLFCFFFFPFKCDFFFPEHDSYFLINLGDCLFFFGCLLLFCVNWASFFNKSIWVNLYKFTIFISPLINFQLNKNERN